MNRSEKNPIITIEDVKPSRSDFKVDGVFNAGATMFNGEVILLLRVAESFVESEDSNIISIPVVNEQGEITKVVLDKQKDSEEYDFSDSRQIFSKKSGSISYLTSLSHLRIARSSNFVDFTIDDEAFIFPHDRYEVWGIEDPRISQIEGTYYINYTAVSEMGPMTKLVKTDDFVTYIDLGVIFLPENKDVSLLSEKINGKYYAYNRPVPKAFGTPDIYISESDNLLYWGNHQHILGVKGEDCWENGRIGGGAPSIKIDTGWLHIYHAADSNDRYCLGAYLAELDNPGKVIAKTMKPILEPIEAYEVNGFFGNVVFTCGVVQKDEMLYIYYGAADDKMCLATVLIDDVKNSMEEYNG